MTDPAPLLPALPDSFDGFRLEIDPARERADVILERAPLNVITMAEREQLRAVFDALDADGRVRMPSGIQAAGASSTAPRSPALVALCISGTGGSNPPSSSGESAANLLAHPGARCPLVDRGSACL